MQPIPWRSSYTQMCSSYLWYFQLFIFCSMLTLDVWTTSHFFLLKSEHPHITGPGLVIHIFTSQLTVWSVVFLMSICIWPWINNAQRITSSELLSWTHSWFHKKLLDNWCRILLPAQIWNFCVPNSTHRTYMSQRCK